MAENEIQETVVNQLKDNWKPLALMAFGGAFVRLVDVQSMWLGLALTFIVMMIVGAVLEAQKIKVPVTLQVIGFVMGYLGASFFMA